MTSSPYILAGTGSSVTSINFYFALFLSGGQYGAHCDPHYLIDSEDKMETAKYKGDGDR